MTTNHRPTLEAKKGRDRKFKDSILHSRSLPQQTLLKTRGDIDEDIGRRALVELKQEQERSQRDSQIEKKRNIKSFEEKQEDSDPIDLKRFKVESGSNTINVEKVDDIIKDPVSVREANSESESESESDDEGILRELEQIRKEKESKAKIQKDSAVLNSNPLLRLAGSNTAEKSKKKSWRSTTFSNKNSKKEAKPNDDFTVKTIDSDSHKKFLSKYIR